MSNLKQVSQNCLNGEALPEDLRRLWEANDSQPWNDFVAFTLISEIDKNYFTGYRQQDGVSADAVAAYEKMFGHIAFVGKLEEGELVGYWRGPENRQVADSPIVQLDTEGQFELLGRNLAEYLLSCTGSKKDFTSMHAVLTTLGFKKLAKSQATQLKSFDDLEQDFGNPNEISSCYQRGLPAPPPSKVRFGHYTFPKATTALDEIGLNGITANTTREQLEKILGEPKDTGGDYQDSILGYIGPWIKYYREDCQLHFTWGKDGLLGKLVVMRADWKPGM